MVLIKTLFFVLFFVLVLPFGAALAAPPQIAGEAGVVMDARNGQVLYQKNGDLKLYPASTTKILTGIIALEKAELDDTVIVSKNAVRVEGTAIGLQKGEKIKLEALLYALLLNSANDAAVAIAEHVGGSVSNFAGMMNEKAEELGAANSHFVNPHGLTDPRHKTTARDLAVIARYAMKNKKFREIVATLNKEIKRGVPADKKPQTWLYNHNRLLGRYDGAIGVKTGYTTAAKLCIVGAARRDNRELIAVVLKSDTPNSLYSDVAALLDYGFEQFESKVLVEEGKIVTRLEVPHGTKGVLVEAANSFTYNIPVGDAEDVTQRVEPLSNLEAPVKKGDVVGELLVRYGDRQVGRVDLLALDDVPRKLTHNWWFWPSTAAGVFFVLRNWIAVRRRRRKYMFGRRRRGW